MADHYYTENPASAHAERAVEFEIFGRVLRCVTDAGVFSRDGLDRGTEVLLKGLPPLTGRVLDLGCGWGAVGLALGARDAALDIVMTDVNARAVALARRNLAANGVAATVVQGDGFEAVSGTFDAIITNPPIRAGKSVIYALFDRAREFLNPGGALYVVIRKQQGAPSALRHLQETWPAASVIDRSSGYWLLQAGGGAPAGNSCRAWAGGHGAP